MSTRLRHLIQQGPERIGMASSKAVVEQITNVHIIAVAEFH